MLTSTFIHLPGISESAEKKLWQQGILTWDDFLSRELPIPQNRAKSAIKEAKQYGVNVNVSGVTDPREVANIIERRFNAVLKNTQNAETTGGQK